MSFHFIFVEIFVLDTQKTQSSRQQNQQRRTFSTSECIEIEFSKKFSCIFHLFEIFIFIQTLIELKIIDNDHDRDCDFHIDNNVMRYFINVFEQNSVYLFFIYQFDNIYIIYFRHFRNQFFTPGSIKILNNYNDWFLLNMEKQQKRYFESTFDISLYY